MLSFMNMINPYRISIDLDLCVLSDMKGKIRVYARWRPLSDKEIREGEPSVLTSSDEFTIEHPWKDDKPKQHQFDHIFDHFATQEQVFEDTKVQPQVPRAFFCHEFKDLYSYTISAPHHNSSLLIVVE